MILPNIFLPSELVYLLKSNLHNTPESIDKVYKFSLLNKKFNLLIRNSFSEFDNERRVEAILKSLGWKNFRDRLTSLYLHHAEYSKIPEKTDIARVDPILKYEERIQPYTVDGYSRGYLFFTYLDFVNIRLREEGKEELNFDQTLLKLLSSSKVKNDKIDWLLLTLWNLSLFIKKNELRKVMDQNGLQTLVSALSSDQSKVFFTNSLRYGYAISEPTAFFRDHV